MTNHQFKVIEKYMLGCMSDSAHDTEHVYRVLYNALDIASFETDVNYDILIAACLLHDFGRKEQFENPALDHSVIGAEKASGFLRSVGYDSEFTKRADLCIRRHRFRTGSAPVLTEEKILFDADKLDVSGALGIARTLLYQGHVGIPLYTEDPDGNISDGTYDANPSFFREYKVKLEKIYSGFYTKRGKEAAADRQKAAVAFYTELLHEVEDSKMKSSAALRKMLT